MRSNIRLAARRPTVRIAAASAAALALAAAPAWCQPPVSPGPPALLDEMEGAAPVLRLLEARGGVRVIGQSLDRHRRRSGSAAERLAVAAPAGASATIGYALPPAPVLDELRLAAWVWCNRPGVQLAALVVLPRSVDPSTGAPRQLLVRSNSPAGGGDWQALALANLPAQLADNVRVARAQNAPDLDERGAYVSHLVLLVPGGAGVTELWVDQITMHGPIGASPKSPMDGPQLKPANSRAAAPTAVAMPSLPRIIQWQGEPMELLQRLGFDGVALKRPATPEELAEAGRLGLWLVCPPRPLDQLESTGIGAEFQQVLAWDLGELSDAGAVDEADACAGAIRRHESVAARSMALRPGAMPLVASRIADVLLLDRPTLGSTLGAPAYAAWLTHQRRLARPGARLWIAVDTHWSSRHMAQLAAIRGGRPAAVAASFDELSLATTASFGTMPRGFYFKSESGLASADPETRRRALALELTNLRLGLVEPWLAAGRKATTARSSRPDLTAMVLTVERSHLLVPAQWPAAPESRLSTPAPGGNVDVAPVSFLLPGVPESTDAYLLSVAGPRRLETRRVAGGLRITLDHLPSDAFILLTEDGYAFAHVDRYLRKHAGRAAQARIELAALHRQAAARAVAALPSALLERADLTSELARVDTQLAAVHQTLARHDFAAAFAKAAEADRLLDRIAQRVGLAIWPDRSAADSPLPVNWTSLPDIARVAAALRSAPSGVQAFPAGDFENLQELLNSGWRRQENSDETVASAVRLSPSAPAAGVYSLELEAKSQLDNEAPPALAAAPVWVTSPPLAVPAGHLVEITGWARVDEVPIGSADPLVIFDSVGGEESSVRLAAAPSWTPFRLVRAASDGAQCRLTIALGGVGKSQVDALRFRFVPLNPVPTEATASAFTPPAARKR
jgi:hypothetical protein